MPKAFHKAIKNDLIFNYWKRTILIINKKASTGNRGFKRSTTKNDGTNDVCAYHYNGKIKYFNIFHRNILFFLSWWFSSVKITEVNHV